MRTVAEISLQRLRANYRAIRGLVGPGVEVVAVVKAGAYGHGAPQAARALEAEGAGWLAVTSIEEGIELRQAGVGPRILILADQVRGRQQELGCAT